MPSSATRESLSMSMADLDFDPAPRKRREKNKRSTRDMSQSCSAFHFVLDPSELGQAGGDGDAKCKNRPSKGKSSSTTSSGSKPSYSDLIMDATSKTAASQFPQLESPTSVLMEEESVLEESARIPEAEEPPAPAGKDSGKPTRSIPSSSAFNRSRNRSFKSKSSHSNTGSEGDPTTPSARARRNRKARADTADTAKFSKSCHIEFDDFAPAQAEFTEADLTVRKSPRTRRRSSTSGGGRQKATDRFSKSFSDFGDWDRPEMATPTRRRGKKPLTVSGRSKSEAVSPGTNNNNRATLPRSQSAEFTAPGFSSREFSSKEFTSREFSKEFPKPTADEHDASNKPFENSFSEMELLGVATDDAAAPVKRGSQDAKGQKQLERNERFSHSFGELDFTSEQDPTPVTPNRRHRRSIGALELKTEVETQKVSLQEFHAPGEENLFPAKPSIRRTRSKKETRGGTPRQNSGMRLRRSQTSSDARPSRSSPRISREDSPAPVMRSSSQEPGPLRSASQGKRTGRRRASMNAKTKTDCSGDGSPGQRRTPRRTKSGDASGIITRAVRDRSTTGERLSGRRAPRRTKSTDGSSMNNFRRMSRSTSMGYGPGAANLDKSMNQSMSVISGVEFQSSMPPRSSSGGGEQSVVRDRTSREGLGSSLTSKSRSTSNPRRKTPARSKSHDGSALIGRKTTRDRERGDRELRASASRDGERNDKELRGSSTRDRGDRELRGSRGASSRKANRRAMAHGILSGE